MTLLDGALVTSRLLQFAAAALQGGVSLFFLYGVPPPRGARWPFRLIRSGAGFGVVGTLAWLMAQAAQMGETTRDALDPAKVWGVAAETGFGRVALLRLGLFLLAFVVSFGPARGRVRWFALAGLGAAASASFAWTGHGVRDEGLAGAIHLTADVLHLLAASIWIGALAALAPLLALAGSGEAARRDALTGLVRFSAIGVAVVSVLVASGLVNSWFLVGPAGVGNLLTSPYGRLLVAKGLLFGLMLGLAAANRYWHTPRLKRGLRAGGATFRPALVSVAAETALALGVLMLVSWLGTLSPPIDA